ncbi:hypothetical protein [Alcaligenes sp. SDU_A2]|uniref:hypothetical protein n=1 Tax=Alcaligenes sp. SDU_A2 TaxID=3136634 RepID=UPI00311DD7D4
MKHSLVAAGLLILGLPLSPSAWADSTIKPCSNCTPGKAVPERGIVDKRLQFSGTAAKPAPAPVTPPINTGKTTSSIFGDGSRISKDFKTVESKNANDTRSVTTSNGSINFTITQDRHNPSPHARHQSIFESGGYRNGQPPTLSPGPTIDELMNRNGRLRR